MSNNGDIEHDGDYFYFSWDPARTVSDIAVDAQVALSFQGGARLLGKPALFVAVENTARIVRDKTAGSKPQSFSPGRRTRRPPRRRDPRRIASGRRHRHVGQGDQCSDFSFAYGAPAVPVVFVSIVKLRTAGFNAAVDTRDSSKTPSSG